MATRLIGTNSDDPRLPAVVIAATQGTTAADLAPGDVGDTILEDANAYTDEQVASIPVAPRAPRARPARSTRRI